jgi:lipid-binding SYLF domain-containing protein
MDRRTFIGLAAATSLSGLGAILEAPEARADTAKQIDAGVDATLQRFYQKVGGSQAFVQAAKGVLVFPRLVKAGIGIGGESGEGALRVDGKTTDYYSFSATSIGLQLGAQTRSVVIGFLQQQALDQFRAASGWTAGINGSIALIDLGDGGAITTDTQPRGDQVLEDCSLADRIEPSGSLGSFAVERRHRAGEGKIE